MFQIDHGVTFPKKESRPKEANPFVETAKAMKLNDSVFFESQKDASKLYKALYAMNRKSGVRKDGEGFRVWRLYGKPTKRGESA